MSSASAQRRSGFPRGPLPETAYIWQRCCQYLPANCEAIAVPEVLRGTRRYTPPPLMRQRLNHSQRVDTGTLIAPPGAVDAAEPLHSPIEFIAAKHPHHTGVDIAFTLARPPPQDV